MTFSTHTINNYRGRVEDYVGLVPAKVAAKMLAMSTANFMEVYSRGGRLKAVNPKGRQKRHYFKKTEVEALVELRKKTVMAPEAAAILGVNITCVHKLKVAGALRPVSGPDVDGFRLNLFLRSDVEKLHAEREAFKAKRLDEGGSSRFGKQAGPQSNPVQSAVGPRIDQLVEEWQQQTPKLRITGQRLYQQLTSEGYQLGINTVYVHLRARLRQAA
jgi:hypothetical protein